MIGVTGDDDFEIPVLASKVKLPVCMDMSTAQKVKVAI
jgi:hypothetical protein